MVVIAVVVALKKLCPVSGITFTTSSEKIGTTNEGGKFTYKKGDTITFSIGDLEFPASKVQADYITPASS